MSVTIADVFNSAGTGQSAAADIANPRATRVQYLSRHFRRLSTNAHTSIASPQLINIAHTHARRLFNPHAGEVSESELYRKTNRAAYK